MMMMMSRLSMKINTTGLLLCLLLPLLLLMEAKREIVTLTHDPAVNIYFNIQDLRPAFKSLFYFSTTHSDDHLHFLTSQSQADSIPFSSPHLPALLRFFSFAPHSPQAKAMESTLKQCELDPTPGELRFCATSLDSMLHFVHSVLAPRGPIKVLTTNLLQRPTVSLQNYTIRGAPTEIIGASGIVACHTLPYPYAVFYCHTQMQTGVNRVFRIGVEGEDGARIDATGVCHMDTSHWDKDHISFQVLHIHPGRTNPVCHFLPADNLLWVSF